MVRQPQHARQAQIERLRSTVETERFSNPFREVERPSRPPSTRDSERRKRPEPRGTPTESGTVKAVESLMRLVGSENSTIPDVLLARASASPDKPFLYWDRQRWTFAQAVEKIQRFSGFLDTLSRPKGRPRVVSYLGNRPEALWGWLGTVWNGTISVAINRQHKGHLLASMLSRSKASILVTESSAIGALPDLPALGIDTVILAGEDLDETSVAGARAVPFRGVEQAPLGDARRPDPPAAASVLYTSGITGPSKAVLVPHNQYCRGAARLVDAYGFDGNDVFHNWLPLSHLGGQLHMTMCAVIAGGSTALFPTFSRSRFWQQVADVNATVICGFAAIMNMIWSLPDSPRDRQNTLRAGIIAGVPEELHEPFERRFDITVAEQYGMTEADPVTLRRPGVEPPTASCGLPSDDFEVEIADHEGSRVSPGTRGEICIRPRASGVMAIGYEDDPAATRAAYRGGWFHTGDLGFMDEKGFLYFAGRLEGSIRRRGENISASEVEATLLEHPDVTECAAVGVPSSLGEEEVKVVVVTTPDSRLDPAGLHAFAAERMARFMVPRYIEVRDRLPKTELGKVRKETLQIVERNTWDAQAARGSGGGRAWSHPADPREGGANCSVRQNGSPVPARCAKDTASTSGPWNCSCPSAWVISPQ